MALVGKVRLLSVSGCLVLFAASAPVCAQEASAVPPARAATPPAPASSAVAPVPGTGEAATIPVADSAAPEPAATAAPVPAPAAPVRAHAAPDELSPIAEPKSIPEASVEQKSAAEERGAERESRSPNDVTSLGLFVNPVGVLLDFYGLELDLSPTKSFSFNFNGVYYDKTVNNISTTAYGLDAGMQFFLTGTKPMAGAYFYPRVGYAKAKATWQTSTSTMSSSYPYTSQSMLTEETSLMGIGATAGYQWNWHPFALRLGGGLVYYTNADPSSGNSDNISMKGTSLLVDFALGFAG